MKKRKREGHLVIVESPAKSKTIHKFLGEGFQVMASMGHIYNLPKNSLGIDIKNNFEPTYEIIPERVKTVEQLRKVARGVERVYLATDMDREGEAIAAHLVEALDLSQERALRVTFNEITPSAIRLAFQRPGRISESKVEAQKARRILDRLVGYLISPLLWTKIRSGLSAGRVQSVALKLVVERELEIRAFRPEEYWELEATFRLQRSKFSAKLKKWGGKAAKISTKEQAEGMVEELRGKEFMIQRVQKKRVEVSPPPPFITSTLQQRASTVLGFSPKKTMLLAQQLYEGVEVGEGSIGLITYMRTDSVNIAQSARREAEEYIREAFGEEYYPKKRRRYRSKVGAQEAHEAIRPTSVRRLPEEVEPYLSRDQARLYELIWRRFVASEMSSAVYDTTVVDVVGGEALFQARGRVLRFEGYLRVYGREEEGEERLLPPQLMEGEVVQLVGLEPSQHFTKAPPRFTEASLVRTLEKEGIGRPSTYAVILSNISSRKYIEIRKRTIYPTELGILLTQRLKQHFPLIMDTKFTSRLEEKLDLIEENKANWVEILREFYRVLDKELQEARLKMKGLNEEEEFSEEVCPNCGKRMRYLWKKDSQGGLVRFLGCSGYPECRTSKSLQEGEPSGGEGGGGEVELSEYVCEECQAPMVYRQGRNGRFLGCSRFPQCRFTMPVDREGRPLELPEVEEEKCPKCGGAMGIKYGKRGPFLACLAYPRCRSTKPIPGQLETVDIHCEKCHKPMAIRYSRRGKFLGCTGYPECKNTKPITVLEKPGVEE